MLINIHWAFLTKLVKDPKTLPRIVGISDGSLIEKTLKRFYRSRYKNYHFHQEPKLDITKVPLSLHASADIISCTEVLEHVAPPIDLAFIGLHDILKEEGILVMSVPHSDAQGIHVEHFPTMTTHKLLLQDPPILIGTLPNGEEVQFKNLVFHGGVGFTLEYRIFSFESIKEYLAKAGFTGVHFDRNFRLFGIVWEKWSIVWIAEKAFRFASIKP
jgi:SAM-dependent methyltransferase